MLFLNDTIFLVLLLYCYGNGCILQYEIKWKIKLVSILLANQYLDKLS